jgi:class 3 adenylate cyclase
MNSHAQFQELLLRYSQEPDAGARKCLEDDLWQRYGAERAVLVLDMSGFSQLTHRYGVIHYLSMVRRMQLTAGPIVRDFGGMPVKFEADNAFAMFPDVLAAVRAALALNRAFDAANFDTPPELDIKISCGIDYGRILVIEGRDFFGDPVNHACKLGEDLARPGEILVTREAMDRLGQSAEFESAPVRFSISGIGIEACSVTGPRAPV